LLEKIEYRVKQKTKKQNIMKKLLLVLLAFPLLFSCGGSLDKERSSEMSDEIPVDGGNQTAEDYFYKANNYMYNGQYQLAIDNYTKCLKLETDDAKKADAYYNRGTVYGMGLENYTAAIADYTSAIRIEPDAADAYYNRGLAYAKLENYTAAIADYTSAIRIDPDYADAYNNRGNQYEKLENYTAAIADYTSAIRINPEDALPYKNRGIAKENAGQSYCSDFKRACDLGVEVCCEWYYKECK
jgi:tetratricopeptide (TPR) repeat protein